MYVIRALGALWEAADATIGSKGREPITTPRDELVDIRLMPDIPNDLIVRAVEGTVKTEREFDHAEVRREMSPGVCDRRDELLSDLLRQLLELDDIKVLEVSR
jgi:hypothetical protein